MGFGRDLNRPLAKEAMILGEVKMAQMELLDFEISELVDGDREAWQMKASRDYCKSKPYGLHESKAI